MADFLRALSSFLARDFLYVVAGSLILAAFIWAIGRRVPSRLSAPQLIIGLGLAHALGYCAQDSISLTGIISSRPILDPPRYATRLYEAFTRRPWKDEITTPTGGVIDIRAAEIQFHRAAFAERVHVQYERYVILKHIGSTIGSGVLVSCAIVFVAWLFRRGWRQRDWAIPVVVGSGLLLAVILYSLSWVKLLQESEYLWKNTQQNWQTDAKPTSAEVK